MANKKQKRKKFRIISKNNLPVVIVVTACRFAGIREQTFAFCNEGVTSKCAQGQWRLRYDERNAL